MTRWVRGRDSNRKRPMEASSWSELKEGVKKTKIKNHTDQSDKIPAAKVSSDRMRQRAVADNLLANSKDSLPPSSSIIGLSSGVAAELEDVSKKNTVAEKVVLEEFVHKNKRREARRIKRQHKRESERVSWTKNMFVIRVL